MKVLISSRSFGKIDYMDNYTFDWLRSRSPIPLVTIPDDAYKFVMSHAISESDVFSEIAEEYGVKFYKRPERLSSNKTINDEFVFDYSAYFLPCQ